MRWLEAGQAMTDIKVLTVKDLKRAYLGSWYFIAGCGGDLEEWVTGYEEWLAEHEIGKPTEWFQVSGETINRFAEQGGYPIAERDQFQPDLTCLMFPLDGLGAGLPMFKLGMQDRWFDDVIQNMRRQ